MIAYPVETDLSDCTVSVSLTQSSCAEPNPITIFGGNGSSPRLCDQAKETVILIGVGDSKFWKMKFNYHLYLSTNHMFTQT